MQARADKGRQKKQGWRGQPGSSVESPRNGREQPGSVSISHRKSYSHLILRLFNEERAMGLGQSYEDVLEFFTSLGYKGKMQSLLKQNLE